MTAGRPRVAVVGGGMAGLTAGLRLRDKGAEVSLYEAAAHPGGMVRTVRRDGWVIDTGAATMAEPEEPVGALLRSAGAADLLVPPTPGGSRRYLVHQGRAVPVPATTAEMVATPLLSVGGRVRMLKEPFVARGGDDEETVSAFARRRFGDEAAARFIDPLVSGTSGGDPDLLLVRYTFPQLVEFERRAGSVLKGRMRASREARRLGRKPPGGGWSARSGLGALAEAMAGALGASIRCDQRVIAIAPAGDGVVVRTADGDAIRFDAVVLALPAPALAQLEWPGAGDSLAMIGAVPHTSLASVALGFRREVVGHPLDGHGLLAPSGERRRILTVQFTSSLFPDRAPPGMVLLTAVVGGVHHDADVSRDDDALVELVRRECEALLAARGEPVLQQVTRWPHAMPMATAGHAERLAAAEAIAAREPRVALCGAWRDGLAVGDVMHGGVAAADRVLQRLIART